MAKAKRRADGRLEQKVYLGKNLDTGKYDYYPVYAYTQKELDEKVLEVKILHKRGIDLSARDETFDIWADRYYKLRLAKSSAKHKKNQLCKINYIKSVIGQLNISKIKPIDIEVFLNVLADKHPTTKKPASEKTLYEYWLLMKNIFELALDNDVIYKNPAAKAVIPAGAPKQQRRALSLVEQRWIIGTEHRARTGALIMMLAGLRKGELIALTWNDIDFDDNNIDINKRVVEDEAGRYVIVPGAKTDAGVRKIPIGSLLKTELQKCSAEKDSIYVFPKADGGMHTDSSWDALWDSYLSVLNYTYGDFVVRPKSRFAPGGVPFVIDKITAHYLRHTYATNLYYAGVGVVEASALLGHAEIKTTLDIYTHLQNQTKDIDVSALDNYIAVNFL